jgi:O-acetylserine/cysteine efflux transporter
MPAAPRPTARFGALDLLVVVVMNLMWGLNIIAVKITVDALAPMTAGLLRQVIVFAICAGSLRIVPGRMVPLLSLGILSGGLFYVVINASLAVATNVSALAIAGQLGVPFSMLLAILVFGERIQWPRMLGIALSLGGVILLVFDPAAAGEGLGLALMAVASAIWAASSLIQRKLAGVPVLTIFAWVGLMGTLVLGIAALATERDTIARLPDEPLRTMGWVAFSAIGSTLIGQGSMSWLLGRHPVSTVTPLTLAAPVLSVFAASYYFGSPLTLLMLLGGGIAMVGVAIVTIRTAHKADGEQRN